MLSQSQQSQQSQQYTSPNNINNNNNNIKNLIASSAGSILTSLIVTPLDVVKVRQQTQAKLPPKSVLQQQFCKQHRKSYRFHFQNKHVFDNTVDAFKKIYKNEGFLSLYRGLAPSILMVVPSTAIYFTSYEYIKGHLYKYGNNSEAYAIYTVPLIAGGLARVVSASATSPLELLRTNQQGITKSSVASISSGSISNHSSTSSSSTCRVLGCSANVCSPVASYSTTRIASQPQSTNSIALYKDIVRAHGIGGLYRSLQSTILRDVPFSSIYWMGYTVLQTKFMKLKYEGYKADSQIPTPFIINFAAGAISGLIAAAITTPIDVIKSRVSVSVLNHNNTNVNTKELSSIRYHFKQIIKEEGFKGLAKGLSARVTKIGAACSIMVSTFEWIKQSNF